MDTDKPVPRVRLKDVAEAAGVSSCTASRALNGTMLNKISEETRIRVLETAARLGYRPNIMARALAGKRTNLLGVLIPGLTDTEICKVLEGILDLAAEQGMGVMLYVTKGDVNKERSYLNRFVQWGVDGIIMIPASDKNIDFACKINRSVPVIQIGSGFKGPESNKILINYEKGGYLATKYLIDKGHKKVAYCSIDDKDLGFLESNALMYNGYLKAIAEADIDMNKKIIYTFPKGVFAEQRIPESINFNGFTAILCSCYKLALVIYNIALRSGLKIPGDLAITGCSSYGMGKRLDPSITSIGFSYEGIGEQAVEKICDVFCGEPPETIVAEPFLIEGDSC